MKKLIKGLISVLLISVLVFSLCSINVFAASTVISFNKKSVSVGDSVTVTVTFNAGEAMYGVEGVVNYDSNVLEYKSGNAQGSAGSLKIVEAPSGEKKVSYTLTFTAKKAGSCVVSVADCNYSGQTTDKGLSGASATMTVKDASLPSNANLKSLKISAGNLSPAFSPNVTSYNITVKNSVTELKVYAVPADSKSKVDVNGSAKLAIGKNTRSIVVTAPNGTQKTYTLNITRNETDDEVIEPETPTNPLEVTVDGATYTILTDLSGVKLFSGFNVEQIDFSGSTVAVAIDNDENYELFYLASAEKPEGEPYVYNSVENTFEKLQYYVQGEYAYIFSDIPSDTTVPDSFYASNVKIGGVDVKCYASSGSGMSDFYYIYCFADGRYGFYRYDSRENSIQRYPELKPVSIETSIEDESKDKNFIDRFKSLSSNGKITLVALALVSLAIIALIVIIVVKLIIRKKSEEQFEEEILNNPDFDSIMVDGFVFDDNDE